MATEARCFERLNLFGVICFMRRVILRLYGIYKHLPLRARGNESEIFVGFEGARPFSIQCCGAQLTCRRKSKIDQLRPAMSPHAPAKRSFRA
jgi:hypothetical protein